MECLEGEDPDGDRIRKILIELEYEKLNALDASNKVKDLHEDNERLKQELKKESMLRKATETAFKNVIT